MLTLSIGIPFAEPPLGQLRLRPPLFKGQLNGTSFNATTFGASCLQPPQEVSLSIDRPCGVPQLEAKTNSKGDPFRVAI
jgi:carboxylesterase type B